jgi:hypothetical protein
MKHFLQFAFFVALTAPLALLPRSLAGGVGEFLGLAAYHLWRSRRGIALANVRGAMERGAIPGGKSPSRIVRKNFMNMGRWASEVVKCYYGLGDSLVRSPYHRPLRQLGTREPLLFRRGRPPVCRCQAAEQFLHEQVHRQDQAALSHRGHL